MPYEIVSPPGGWGAAAIAIGSLGGAIITQIGLAYRASRIIRFEEDRIQYSAADRANNRLAEVLEQRIDELREELDEAKDKLEETQKSLDERTEEWMIASRAHEDCERRLSRIEARLEQLERK